MLRSLIWVGLPLIACIAAGRVGLLIVTVRGDSMLPTYRHGDRVLAIRRRFAGLPKDAVVVARLPETVIPVRQVLKRVAARAGEIGPDGTMIPAGQIFLLGDAKGSTDSRAFGPVAVDSILGIVVLKLRPAPSDLLRRRGGHLG